MERSREPCANPNLTSLRTKARSESFIRRRELINYRRACFADHLILRIGTTRTAHRTDNLALLNEWNAASRRNDPIERQQIVKMHKLDTVLEDLGRTPERRGCPRLVLRNLHGSEHGAVHSLKGNQVPA